MNRNRNLATLGVAVCVVALAAGPWVQCALGDSLTYSDDFSTDKAMVDAYFHSDFLDDLPDPWPSGGFLMYEESSGDTALSFYYGSVSDAHAWLRYELPLDGGTPGADFASGRISLELVDTWGDGWIQCACFADQSQPWEWPVVSGEPGPHSLEFVASELSDTVQVWFRGCNASIDDLVVVLNYWTPVEAGTWARIKRMFDGPRS